MPCQLSLGMCGHKKLRGSLVTRRPSVRHMLLTKYEQAMLPTKLETYYRSGIVRSVPNPIPEKALCMMVYTHLYNCKHCH